MCAGVGRGWGCPAGGLSVWWWAGAGLLAGWPGGGEAWRIHCSRALSGRLPVCPPAAEPAHSVIVAGGSLPWGAYQYVPVQC